MWRRALAALVFWVFTAAVAWSEGAPPTVILPETGFIPEDLAVVINEDDPLSVKIGEYYAERRGLPDANVVRLRFPVKPVLSPKEFKAIWAALQAHTPAAIQAYALTWVRPYRVGCMSVTTAFAVGYDEAYCAQGCKLTRPSPYFNSDSRQPFEDYGLRPAMTIAAEDFSAAKVLIDRGVAADGSAPAGTAYLLDTSDRARNVRSLGYGDTLRALGDFIRVERVHADILLDRSDVLFYFTGLIRVKGLHSNHFLPGAVADHLTSTGGVLTGSGQMNVLEWLRAGATASYGAVVEPCNFPQKFPAPGLAIARYLQGESLIEAYWKSVAMPGQGVFVGEPLARPYKAFDWRYEDGDLRIHVLVPVAGRYRVVAADSSVGPYRPVAVQSKKQPGGRIELLIPDARHPYYRLERGAVLPPRKPPPEVKP